MGYRAHCYIHERPSYQVANQNIISISNGCQELDKFLYLTDTNKHALTMMTGGKSTNKYYKNKSLSLTDLFSPE